MNKGQKFGIMRSWLRTNDISCYEGLTVTKDYSFMTKLHMHRIYRTFFFLQQREAQEIRPYRRDIPYTYPRFLPLGGFYMRT